MSRRRNRKKRREAPREREDDIVLESVEEEELEDEDDGFDEVQDTEDDGVDPLAKVRVLEGMTPSEKLQKVMDSYAGVFPKDHRFKVQVYRDAPEKDVYGHECRGYLGSYREPMYEDTIRERFGGQLFHLAIHGPFERDGKIVTGFVPGTSVYGIEVAAPAKPAAEDKHYQSSEGIKVLDQFRADGRDVRRAQERRLHQEVELKRKDEDTETDGTDEQDETPKRLFRPQVAQGPVRMGTQGDKDLERLRLQAEIDREKQRQQREFVLQDKLMEGGKAGLDGDTLRELLTQVKDGNQQAIQTFAQTVSSGNEKTSQNVENLLNLVKEQLSKPPDTREAERLQEQLKDAKEDLRALRSEHQAELTRVQEGQRKDLERVEERAERELERAVRELKEQYRSERELIVKQNEFAESEVKRLEEKLEAADRRLEDRLAMVQTNHEAQLRNLEENYKTRIESREQRIKFLEELVESKRSDEIVLRDAKQNEAMERRLAERDRDAAKADAERLDIDKIVKSQTAAKSVAESLGYEKPDTSGPSTIVEIGKAIIDAGSKVLTNDKFSAMVEGLTGTARDVLAERKKAELAQNPAPPLPTSTTSGQSDWEDLVRETRKARGTMPEPEPKQPEAPAPIEPQKREQLKARSRKAHVTEESAKEALDQALSQQAPEQKPKGPLPVPKVPDLDEPEDVKEDDAKFEMIDTIEEFAVSNKPKDEALDHVLEVFGVSRDMAKVFVGGKSGDDLLAMVKIDPAELSGQARAYFNDVLKTL